MHEPFLNTQALPGQELTRHKTTVKLKCGGKNPGGTHEIHLQRNNTDKQKLIGGEKEVGRIAMVLVSYLLASHQLVRSKIKI